MEILLPVPSDLIAFILRSAGRLSTMIFDIFVIMLLSIYSGPNSAFADPEHLSAPEHKGVGALAQRHYDEAFSAFSEGLQAAKISEDQKWQATFLFYLGLTEQRKAEESADSVEQGILLGSAANYYNRMLGLDPKSGAALNNLAKVHLKLGNDEEAERYYKRAIDLGDKNRWFYALNYSNFLNQKGKKQDALKYAITAALEQPSSLKAHHFVLTLCEDAGNTSELTRYLYRLMHRGAVDRAQRSALDALDKLVCQDEDCKKLIILIAATLSRQYYEPEHFFRTDIGEKLNSLRFKPGLKQPIQELEMLHRGETFRDRYYSWWKHDSTFSVDVGGRNNLYISSREAFRELSRSIGSWYRRSKKPHGNEWAERYYLLAINFVDERYADPKSFLDLADLYINTGQEKRLNEIRYQYEDRLYHGKGEDYGEVHTEKLKWKNIYEYHQALGFMYAHLKEWENPRTYYASAIFQLSHALIAADNFNRFVARRGGIGPIAVSPQVYALLSQAYFETSRDEEGMRVAVEGAEKYLNKNNEDYAAIALKFVQQQNQPVVVSRNLKNRYERVIRRLPQLRPVSVNSAPPRTIKLTNPNMKGDDVRELQRALNAHGIDVSIDGVFGPDSQKALKRFQVQEGLPASGELDPATRSTLKLK